VEDAWHSPHAAKLNVTTVAQEESIIVTMRLNVVICLSALSLAQATAARWSRD